MPFEDDLEDAFHRTGETFTVDHRAVVEGALCRGRIRLLRRRAAVGAVAVIAVAGSTMYGGWALGLTSTRDVAAHERPSDPKSTDPGWDFEVSADQMVQILARTLPEGQMTEKRGTGNSGDPKQPGKASLVYDDGFGKALVEFSIKRVALKGKANEEVVLCPEVVTPPDVSCTSPHRSDGTGPSVFKGFTEKGGKGLIKWRTATRSREGFLIETTTYNGLPEQGTKTRDQPPFTDSQTQSLATILNPAINEYGIPNPIFFTHERRVRGNEDVARQLAGLQRDFAKVSPGGDSATGFVMPYDAKNKTTSFMRVTLTPKRSPGDEPPQWSDTLPGGAKLATSVRPGEGKDATEWRVDVLHPNGLRVTVTSYNAEFPDRPANRTTPPATLEELKAIALDEMWLRVR